MFNGHLRRGSDAFWPCVDHAVEHGPRFVLQIDRSLCYAKGDLLSVVRHRVAIPGISIVVTERLGMCFSMCRRCQDRLSC